VYPSALNFNISKCPPVLAQKANYVSGDPATQEYTFVWGQIISGYMFAHFDFTFCNRVFYSPV